MSQSQTAGLISPLHKCSPLSSILIFLFQPSENQFTIQMRSSISGKVWNSIKIQGLNGNENDGFAVACLCSFDDELRNRLLYNLKHTVQFGKHDFAWTLGVYDFISVSCSGCVFAQDGQSTCVVICSDSWTLCFDRKDKRRWERWDRSRTLNWRLLKVFGVRHADRDQKKLPLWTQLT